MLRTETYMHGVHTHTLLILLSISLSLSLFCSNSHTPLQGYILSVRVSDTHLLRGVET